MAKFFYANTWHPELLSRKNGTSPERVKTVELDGKKWLYVPRECPCWIIPPSGLKDYYISFEYALPPFSSEYLREKDLYGVLWNTVGAQSYFCVAYNAKNGSGGNYADTLVEFKRETINNVGSKGEGSTEQQYINYFVSTNGVWSSKITYSSGLGDLANIVQARSCKILSHFTSNYHTMTTSFGSGTTYNNQINGYATQYFYFAGILLRNIIISEEPISFSDTIREVEVDSVTGTDWYTSNGKSYTENVNATANVKLNSVSLAEAKRVLEARKFAFSGVTNRQGERINALEVKRANEAHQSIVDVGEHTFGSSWSVNSPSEITDTLTITSRKVVGK